MTVVDGTIRLKMSTNITTKDDSDGKMLGFAIAGNDRHFYPAETQWFTDGSMDNRNRPQFQHDILVLSSPFVPKPVHYRYAWARNPLGNLVSPQHVPLPGQRSDDWLLEETPDAPDKTAATDDAAKRLVARQNQKKLELIDLERRLKEAKAEIEHLKPILEKAEAGH